MSRARREPDETRMPNCREGCKLPHTVETAMILLGVGRTRLYELMNDRDIEYLDTDYGRRIRHDVITGYLTAKTVK